MIRSSISAALSFRWIAFLVAITCAYGCSVGTDSAVLTEVAAQENQSSARRSPETEGVASEPDSAKSTENANDVAADRPKLDILIKQIVSGTDADRERAVSEIKSAGANPIPLLIAVVEDAEGKLSLDVMFPIRQWTLEEHHGSGKKHSGWADCSLLNAIDEADAEVRRKAIRVTRELFRLLPDQIGLIQELRKIRKATKHWDVIVRIPTNLEEIANDSVSIVVDALVNGDSNAKDQATELLAVLEAIGEPARVPLLRANEYVLRSSPDLSFAELEVNLQRQFDMERRRRKADYLTDLHGPKAGLTYSLITGLEPSADLARGLTKLEVAKEERERKQVAADKLMSAVRGILIHRNAEMYKEAISHLPDPDKYPLKLVNNELAIADLLMMAGEQLLKSGDANDVMAGARLLRDSLSVSRLVEPPRPLWLSYRTALLSACAMDRFAPEFAPMTQVGTIEALDNEYKKNPKDQKLGHQLYVGLGDVANLCWNRSEIETARDLAVRRIAVAEDVYGKETTPCAFAKYQQSVFVFELGDIEKAIDLATQAKGPLQAGPLAAQGASLDCVSSLIGYLLKADRVSEAEALTRETLSALERVKIVGDLRVLRFQERLGRCIHKQGQSKEAEKIVRDVLLKLEELGEADSGQAAQCYEALGFIMKDTNRPKEARQNFERAYEIRLKLHGPTHPVTQRLQRAAQDE